MKDKVLEWFAHGETGTSSKAMACAVCDIEPREGWQNHPRDPDDLKRCVFFLDEVPEARQHLHKVAKLSSRWSILIQHWDELEAMLRKELPAGRAPLTYRRMKELFEQAVEG